MVKSDFRKGIEQGLGFFGVGIALFTLIIGVYAFVEPNLGPANDYVLNWASPINAMHNDTNVKVNDIDNKITNINVQTGSLSVNSGMYDNRIPANFNPPNAYTIVCFKEGSTLNDQMGAGVSTNTAINCQPGDVGFIIEANERSNLLWENAKAACLQDNMRLPEVFEFKYSCNNAGVFGLTAMTNNFEWVSNSALPVYVQLLNSKHGVGVPTMGNTFCYRAEIAWVGRHSSNIVSHAFRCTR